MTDQTQADALRALIEKGEAGEWSSVRADEFFATDKAGNHQLAKATDAFLGSLDAAKSLHEALLPGWTWWRCGDTGDMFVDDGTHLEDVDGRCDDNPARAWLLAILKAKLAEVEA